MKNFKWAMTISGAVLASLLLSGSVFAGQSPQKSNTGNRSITQHDQPLQNASGRQRLQLSERKLAARRLKDLHDQARQQHMERQIQNGGQLNGGQL